MSGRGHNPGASAANGIEEIIKGLKKAKQMIGDNEVGKMIANSIVRLSNTMSSYWNLCRFWTISKSGR